MSTLASIALIACVVNIGLPLIILLSNFRSTLNRVYLIWSSAVFVWNATSIPLLSSISPGDAFFWMHILQAGVFLLPASLFHVCVATIGKDSYKVWLASAYGIAAVFFILLGNGQMISGVRKLDGGYWAVANWGYYLFIVYFMVLTVAAMGILYKQQKIASPLNKRRIRALLYAILGLWIFGTNDLLPIFGVTTYPIIMSDFIPIGNAASIGYAFIIGYSVIQHQLLDVKVGLSKLASSLIRVGLHTVVGLFILSLLLIFLPVSLSGNIVITTTIVVLASGALSSYLFPKILGKGNDALERRLLGDSFLYQEKLSDFISSIPLSTNIKLLFEDLEILLVKIVAVKEYRIILLDELTRGLTFFQAYPETKNAAIRTPASESVFFQKVMHFPEDYFVVDDLDSDEMSGFKRELEEVYLSKHAQFCFVLKSDEAPYGFFLISGKENGEPFTKSDLDLLDLLVRNLGLIINQIRLKEKIQVEQELDLLGRISKGLAHDLNNLLTPVATLLQVSNSAPSGDPEVDDLVATADRNVSTMRKYIRDSLFFSKTLKPQLSGSSLGEVTQASINTLLPQARLRGISIAFDPGIQVTAVLDTILYQRLVANLVSNAIDASPQGSTINLEVFSAPGRDGESEWIQLKVIDHGEGISPENLEKMRAAFFTTKDSGDGKRGFGLGLAICRKIVHLHGGTLNITSELGKGTTVQVDLPNGQLPIPIVAEPQTQSVAT